MRWCGLCCCIFFGLIAVIIGIVAFDKPSKAPATSRIALDSELVQVDMGNLGSGQMFDRIAHFYDLCNYVMSLGQDMTWRHQLVNECLQVKDGDIILDLATGTADVALLAAKKIGKGKVVGVDPSVDMLKRGQEKVDQSHLPIELYVGDAQNLTATSMLSNEKNKHSISDGSIDKISMAFGIRNVKNRFVALQEMLRVLKRNEASRVCILEFNLPDPSLGVISSIAYSFVQYAVPLLGLVASMGDGTSEYKYLAESIRNFPSPEMFMAIMNRAGLKTQSVTHLMYGAVQIYEASV